MTIWVDADSFPREAKELIQRRAHALGLRALFLANRSLSLPDYKEEKAGSFQIIVEKGEGKADDFILSQAKKEDLVATRDLPLAKALVEKDIITINDRGEQFDKASINTRISMRDFMSDLRLTGLATEKGRTYGKAEYQAFANAFEKAISLLRKRFPSQ